MKKLLLPLFLLVALLPLSAEEATQESRLFVHPFKEVFVNFPTDRLGSGVRLSVFLPEEKIPCAKSYPLVVFLNLPREELDGAEDLARTQQVIIAVISWEKWAQPVTRQPQAVAEFIHRDLMPYLETNYPVLPGAAFRTLVARGEIAAQAVLQQLVHPDFVEKFVLLEPGQWELPNSRNLNNVRVFVRGNQAELAHAQGQFEQAGLSYGPGFAMQYTFPENQGLHAIDFDYLNTPAEQLVLKRLDAFTQKETLSLQADQQTGLRVGAKLKNNRWYAYVPQHLRLSPPYLTWDAASGMVQIIPGAQPGTVKIREVVDNLKFSVKIKLKK